jgi:hypothetical protein
MSNVDHRTVRICTDRIHPRDLQRVQDAGTHRSPSDAARVRMAILTGKKWDNGRTLKVSFLDGLPEVQQRVIPFARQWESFANLTFDVGDHADADIRISFAQAGSWSYLGTDALGIRSDLPTMNFGWLTPEVSDREYERVVTHEFGHALGAIHEHQSPGAPIPWDKEKVYAFYAGPPNNWTRDQVDVNLFQHYAATVTQFSAFDRESIMLYAIPNDLTVGDWEVGWNTKISGTDKAFIATLYPGAGGPGPARVSVDGGPVSESIGTPGEEDEFAFDVTESGDYTIETAGDTDVVMAVFGPDTRQTRVGLDDDSGPGLNARLHLSLDPGEYRVFVRHYSRARTGDYQLSVSSG